MRLSYEELKKYRPDINKAINLEFLKHIVIEKIGACPKGLTLYDVIRLICIHYKLDCIIDDRELRSHDEFFSIDFIGNGFKHHDLIYRSYDKDYSDELEKVIYEVLNELPKLII